MLNYRDNEPEGQNRSNAETRVRRCRDVFFWGGRRKDDCSISFNTFKPHNLTHGNTCRVLEGGWGGVAKTDRGVTPNDVDSQIHTGGGVSLYAARGTCGNTGCLGLAVMLVPLVLQPDVLLFCIPDLC